MCIRIIRRSMHGEQRFTWRETYARCRRLASALARRGIGKNDTVAVMAPNIPAMYEAHFGVPMCGAVLNTLNTRLDAETIAFMLRHGGARALITDREFSATIEQALALLDERPLVIDIDDPSFDGGKTLGEIGYEAFLAEGDPDYAWQDPADEWDAISLNYTSGTTGDPKGVVYHHRGAYLNAISNMLDWDMPQHAVYLWTLPMFHCNGWCFPWSVAERAGTSVCLRRVEAKAALDAIREHKVTHMCGAPIVYSMLINAPEELRREHRSPDRRPDRRRRAARRDHRRRREDRHRADPCLWPDRDLWSRLGLRQARRWSAHADRPARRTQRAPGRARADAGGDDGAGSRDDGAGAVGRRDDGRDHVPRQHHHEGVSEESRRQPRRRLPVAGSIPAISR